MAKQSKLLARQRASSGTQNGWHLVKTGESNSFICSMSLADVPTVEAVPVVHGRWLPTNDPDKKRCSRCDVIHKIAQYPHGAIDWCPNCGADMRGGKNNV